MLRANSAEIGFEFDPEGRQKIRGRFTSDGDADTIYLIEDMFRRAISLERVNFIFRNKTVIIKNLVITRIENSISGYPEPMRYNAEFVATDAFVLPSDLAEIRPMIEQV